MRILTYVFETSLTFSKPVSDHSFVLRCMPKNTSTQTVMDSQIFTSPRATMTEQTDGFGNRIMVGYLPEEHDSFNYYTSGQAMVAPDLPKETQCHPMFMQPTRLTRWTDEMAAFAQAITKQATAAQAGTAQASGDQFGAQVTGHEATAQAPIAQAGAAQATASQATRQPALVMAQAQALCSAVHERFDYVAGVTNISTTAAEAFDCETGVCQDYTHVMIALCRSVGIPARYVTGLMSGHGATHAWVEVYDGQYWRGLDPTNNVVVDDSYMMFATGRDFEDCPIECGIFRGTVEQTQEVSASLGDSTSQNMPDQLLTF